MEIIIMSNTAFRLRQRSSKISLNRAIIQLVPSGIHRPLLCPQSNQVKCGDWVRVFTILRSFDLLFAMRMRCETEIVLFFSPDSCPYTCKWPTESDIRTSRMRDETGNISSTQIRVIVAAGVLHDTIRIAPVKQDDFVSRKLYYSYLSNVQNDKLCRHSMCNTLSAVARMWWVWRTEVVQVLS